MFNRFIIVTDLLPMSYAMVACLGGLKSYGATHCLLLQCLSFREASSIALSYSTTILGSILQQRKEILEGQGLTVETRTIPGFAKQEINQIAEKENYSLVVVGMKRSSAMQ